MFDAQSKSVQTCQSVFQHWKCLKFEGTVRLRSCTASSANARNNSSAQMWNKIIVETVTIAGLSKSDELYGYDKEFRNIYPCIDVSRSRHFMVAHVETKLQGLQRKHKFERVYKYKTLWVRRVVRFGKQMSESSTYAPIWHEPVIWSNGSTWQQGSLSIVVLLS